MSDTKEKKRTLLQANDGPPSKHSRATASPVIRPMAPRLDPFVGGTSKIPRQCVLYLCCDENTDRFREGLELCRTTCAKNVHEHCFQRDGTRHVTLWQGKLTDADVAAMQTQCDKNSKKIQLPVTISFTAGWNNWKSGNYLGLTTISTVTLKRMVHAIMGDAVPFSVKPKCDHLSLYRKRGGAGVDLGSVRKALIGYNWGSLPGTSIRVKVLGEPYDECKVLAEGMVSGGGEDDEEE